MILQDIVNEIIEPIVPPDAFLSTKKMNLDDKSICVDYADRQTDLGIISKYNTIQHKHITITIRWTNSYTETEIISNQIYDAIKNIFQKQYENFKVNFIAMDNNAPIDQKNPKTDAYVKIINFEIYYDEQEE